MSLFEFLYIGHTLGNNRRGLRLPLLLGRLHLGLIFSGPCSSSSGRKANSEQCTLRSFLFIATVLITKCGSSAFPNRNQTTTSSIDAAAADNLASSSLSSTASTPSSAVTEEDSMFFYLLAKKHLRDSSAAQHDNDHQDYPLQHILNMHNKGTGHHHFSTVNGQYIGDHETQAENVKTVGYVLKGMILPMLISLTLSFGFVIYKNRVKRARLQAIQNALEQARLNPNQIVHPQSSHGIPGNLVSNALLSVLETRGGEWSLISGGSGPGRSLLLDGDDYVGEGGETARHKPYLHDRPPDYASVFDPPTYEQATASVALVPSDGRNSKVMKGMMAPTMTVLHDRSNIVDVGESEHLLPFSSGAFLIQGDCDLDEGEADEERESGGTEYRVLNSLFD